MTIEIDKKTFIETLEKSGKFDWDIFDVTVPKELGRLLFGWPWQEKTLRRKREFQEKLREENCIGELLKIFQEPEKDKNIRICQRMLEWVDSTDFTSMVDIEKYTGKNIAEVFLKKKNDKLSLELKEDLSLELKKEREIAWQNPEFRNAKVKEFRNIFSEKMKATLPERLWVKFIENAAFIDFREATDWWEYKYIMTHKIIAKKVRQHKEKDKLDIYLDAFIKDWFRYLWKSFAAMLKEYIDGDIWLERHVVFDDDKFETMEAEQKKLAHNKPENNLLSGKDGKQMQLFKDESKIISNSWNEKAINWLNYWLASQDISINTETIPYMLIYSEWQWKGKQELIDNAELWFKDIFPNANVKKISGKKLYEIYAATKMVKPGENNNEREVRFEKLKIEFNKINLLIITDIEELENKIKTQEFILELMGRKNLKVIFASNKKVKDFPEEYVEKSKDKTVTKWFLKKFKEKLNEIPQLETDWGKAEECWPLLANELKKLNIVNIPLNLINGIAKILPQPNIYGALAVEIRLACANDTKPFTEDMAYEIVKKRENYIYNCSVQDIHKIVQDYFFDPLSTKDDTEKINQYTAYFCKKIKGLWEHEKTNKKIAEWLHIKESEVRKYIKETINAGWHTVEIGEKIKEFIERKEKAILANKNLFPA